MGATLIGVLVAGMLIGSWLAGTSAFWWLVIALGVVAFGGGIVLYIIDKARGTSPNTEKPLTKV